MLTCTSGTHRLLSAPGALCVALAIALGFTHPASARQDGGSLPQTLVSSSSPLTPDQVQRVRGFVEPWVRDIAGGDPAQAARGRNELAQPPGRPGATPTFHREYAGVLRPMLEPIIFADDDFRAINAMIVLRALRTPESVDALVRLSAPRTERRATVRLRAAGLLVDAVVDSPLNPAQIDGITRAVAESAATDPEWVAAYHGFRTLARISGKSGLPASSVALALQSQVDVMRRLVEKAEGEIAPSESIKAIARALLVARDQIATLADEENRALLRRGLAPALVRLAKVADAHWDAAHATPESTKAYGDALHAADLLLKLEAQVRRMPLAIDLAAKWRAGDRSGFAADVVAANSLATRT